jgi:hypothetical protein
MNARCTTAQACVGAVATLNKHLGRLHPDFNDAQKLPDKDIMDVLATKAPKEEHKALMIEQGFNPETSTVEEFVEISKRAETKKTIHEEHKRCFNSKDISSSDDERPNKKQKPTKEGILLQRTWASFPPQFLRL